MKNTLSEIKLAPVLEPQGELCGTKLGGNPEWIQGEWKPECCDGPMTFLGQLDSLDIPEAKLPDSALVYVFFCPQCFHTTSQLQCC